MGGELPLDRRVEGSSGSEEGADEEIVQHNYKDSVKLIQKVNIYVGYFLN
jgi:hypothetical protein